MTVSSLQVVPRLDEHSSTSTTLYTVGAVAAALGFLLGLCFTSIISSLCCCDSPKEAYQKMRKKKKKAQRLAARKRMDREEFDMDEHSC